MIKSQVNTAKAEAEMAYGLQASKVQARIKEEEMQVTLTLLTILPSPGQLDPPLAGEGGGETAGDQHPAAGNQQVHLPALACTFTCTFTNLYPCRKEKQLESTVRKPAEAEKYRLEKIAEADARKVGTVEENGDDESA